MLQKMSWAKQLSPINSNTGEAEAEVFITRSSRLAWMEYKAVSDESGWGGIPKDSRSVAHSYKAGYVWGGVDKRLTSSRDPSPIQNSSSQKLTSTAGQVGINIPIVFP